MTVLVVGSVNVDLSVALDRRPEPGETVLGTRMTRSPGGKGANQALAAARAGAAVSLLAAVGDDADGASYLTSLGERGVDCSTVRTVDGMHTGYAIVTVTPDGENSIVVIPGANGQLRARDVERLTPSLNPGDVVLAQMEVSDDVIEAATLGAATSGSRFMLNPSPCRTVSPGVLRQSDPLVVNVHEASMLLGLGDRSGDPGPALAESLLVLGARSVVLTLGAAGAIWAVGGRFLSVPAPPVEVVDTTGAGDAFTGTLAAALDRGESDTAALEAAVAAGALATTHSGAQDWRLT